MPSITQDYQRCLRRYHPDDKTVDDRVASEKRLYIDERIQRLFLREGALSLARTSHRKDNPDSLGPLRVSLIAVAEIIPAIRKLFYNDGLTAPGNLKPITEDMLLDGLTLVDDWRAMAKEVASNQLRCLRSVWRIIRLSDADFLSAHNALRSAQEVAQDAREELSAQVLLLAERGEGR